MVWLDVARIKVVPTPLPGLGDTQEAEVPPRTRIDLPLREIPQGRACLLVVTGPQTRTQFDLDGDAVAGRHPACDVVLDDITVSRRHAELRRLGDVYQITDLGSLNGTYVNSDRIARVVLRSGDEVQIGKFRFAFLANL